MYRNNNPVASESWLVLVKRTICISRSGHRNQGAEKSNFGDWRNIVGVNDGASLKAFTVSVRFLSPNVVMSGTTSLIRRTISGF